MAQLRLTFTDDSGAWLIFYDPDKTNTAPTSNTGSDNGIIFIPKDQYPWHIDLLRNEQPVYYVNKSGFWQGSLRTGTEAVGEGE